MIAENNLRWAFALIDALAAAGVEHAVISPGSRSTPLVLACDRHPGLRTWVQVDERCAAFFALGIGLRSGRPAALIATSGSAPAHWYPAVIEASESAVPLILLSADRPPELHGCGANQTTDQARLFGSHVRAFRMLPVADGSAPGVARAAATDAVARSLAPVPGPVHLDVPFREPLVAGALELPPPAPRRPMAAVPGAVPAPALVAELARAFAGRPGLIVAGRRAPLSAAPAPAVRLAERLRCPLLADPLSGLRFGGHARGPVITGYDSFLRAPAFRARHRPEWVLQLGATPVSKVLGGYLAQARPDPFVLVDPYGRRYDPAGHASALLACDPAALCTALAEASPRPAPADWAAAFAAADRDAAEPPCAIPPEGRVVQALVERLPAGSWLFSGNSMPVRDLDAWSGAGAKPLQLLANRGVSGIDGNISTLAGLAAAGGGPVAGLIGDLACVHDLNGLLAARTLDGVLVVLNNGGGGIFGYLPQAGLAGFERLWLTPTGLDLEQAARLYGVGFQRVADPAAFPAALERALRGEGFRLIEVMIDREASRTAHRANWDRFLDETQ